MLQDDSNKEWKHENMEPLPHESDNHSYKEVINFKRERIYLCSIAETYHVTGQYFH